MASDMMIYCRSYLAFVFMPAPRIFEWVAKLDEWTSQFAGHFVSKPVVLNLLGLLRENIVAAILRHVTLQSKQIQVRMHREASVSRLAIEVEISV